MSTAGSFPPINATTTILRKSWRCVVAWITTIINTSSNFNSRGEVRARERDKTIISHRIRLTCSNNSHKWWNKVLHFFSKKTKKTILSSFAKTFTWAVAIWETNVNVCINFCTKMLRIWEDFNISGKFLRKLLPNLRRFQLKEGSCLLCVKEARWVYLNIFLKTANWKQWTWRLIYQKGVNTTSKKTTISTIQLKMKRPNTLIWAFATFSHKRLHGLPTVTQLRSLEWCIGKNNKFLSLLQLQETSKFGQNNHKEKSKSIFLVSKFHKNFNVTTIPMHLSSKFSLLIYWPLMEQNLLLRVQTMAAFSFGVVSIWIFLNFLWVLDTPRCIKLSLFLWRKCQLPSCLPGAAIPRFQL